MHVHHNPQFNCLSGNADVDTVLASTLKVCDAAGARPDIPIGRGDEHDTIQNIS